MKHVHPLPTMLTLGNFGCGFLAIVLAARSLMGESLPIRPFGEVTGMELLLIACYCVFLAMIFDMLDGKIARLTDSASRFGGEMDSLADVVSFGIAPAVIFSVSRMFVAPLPRHWWSLSIVFGLVYASCACLRLARYNVEMGAVAKDYFYGLPSPAAAGAVTSLFLLIQEAGLDPETHYTVGIKTVYALAIYMLFIGLLMVTRVRYPHVTNLLLYGRKRFTHFVIALFVLLLLYYYPAYLLLIAFNGYVLWGLGWEAIRKLPVRWRPGKAWRSRANASLTDPLESDTDAPGEADFDRDELAAEEAE
ncbi:MAG: CDP-diacylglycerol--serine O-phosphatidyltransferase [Planctomycetota bacterium]